jgi:hypothetical protein
MALKSSKNSNVISTQSQTSSDLLRWLWSATGTYSGTTRDITKVNANLSKNGIGTFSSSLNLYSAAVSIYGVSYNIGSFPYRSAFIAAPTVGISDITSSSGIIANTSDPSPFVDNQIVFLYAAGTSPYQVFTKLPSNAQVGPNQTRVWSSASASSFSVTATTPGAGWRLGTANHFLMPVPTIIIKQP